MKFTLSWLKDYLETDASLDAIAAKLTALGLEVESVTDYAKQLSAFKVAKIVDAKQHPQADRLRVCMVDNGAEQLQIVCGAPNARAGLRVVLAPIGTVIPANNLTIKKSAIRGVESNGMLCSAEELGLGGESDGIIELPDNDNVPLGGAAAAALGFDDAVIEIAITPNRADCLGVYGIARDLAAAGMGKLKLLKLEKPAGKGASKTAVKLDSEAAPYYIGRYFSGVKNAESPQWLKSRLKAIGQKPISALVDITNYITFDLGRPLHVYDAKKLTGNLSVRASKPGEKITALNDKEYTLSGELVIADDKAPVAIAGIIGGKDTGVSETTTDVFLEVAYFDPVVIRKAGQKLQIDSDAKYRFERGVDPQMLETGAEIATRMILELCGGSASELVIAGKNPHQPKSIAFDVKKVETLAGVKVTADEAKTILENLGFVVAKDFAVSVPSGRADIEGEADLVEEILRVKGYDTIPLTPLPGAASAAKPALSPAQRQVFDARRQLAARGLTEAVTFSFMHSEKARDFAEVKPEVVLVNPISDLLDVMRPSILPNLLEASLKNTARGQSDLALFEIGPVYTGAKPEENKQVIAGLRTGHTAPKNLYKETREVDAFDAKADAFSVIAPIVDPEKITVEQGAPKHYHPGRSGTLKLGPNLLGYFGEIHPALKAKWKIEDVAVAFEIFADALPNASRAKTKAAISDYQPVTRDFAFVVEDAVTAASLTKAVRGAEKTLIQTVSVFDIYAGKGLGEGKKSIAISVVMQAADRTLTDKEIDAVADAIVAKVTKDTGGSLRS